MHDDGMGQMMTAFLSEGSMLVAFQDERHARDFSAAHVGWSRVTAEAAAEDYPQYAECLRCFGAVFTRGGYPVLVDCDGSVLDATSAGGGQGMACDSLLGQATGVARRQSELDRSVAIQRSLFERGGRA